MLASTLNVIGISMVTLPVSSVSFSMTPSDPTNSYGSVSWVPSNTQNTETASYWEYYQDTSTEGFGLHTEFYVNSNAFCNGISEFQASFDGTKVGNLGDHAFYVSMGNKYFVFFHDLDGWFGVDATTNDRGGLFVYPQCGECLATSNEVSSLMDGEYDFRHVCNSDGNGNNDCEMLVNRTFNGNAWPINISVSIDTTIGTTTAKFDTDTINGECTYNDLFDVQSDVNIYNAVDLQNERVQIYSVDGYLKENSFVFCCV